METVRWLRLSGILLLLLAVYFLAPVDVEPRWENLVRLVGSVLVFTALGVGMVYQLRAHIDDTSRRIDGLIIGIVLVVVVFAHTFFVMQQQDSKQFVDLNTRLDSLYFTTSTLVTVGTGDVHAAGQPARALVLIQMVFNVVFVATTATVLTSRIREAAQTRARTHQRRQTGTAAQPPRDES